MRIWWKFPETVRNPRFSWSTVIRAFLRPVGYVAFASVVFYSGLYPALLSADEGGEGADAISGALYRYRNAQGNQVIDFSIPPEFVDKGYDILSANGRLIKQVPARTDAELTPEQIAAREEQEKLDAFILRTYSSLEDVARARTRRLQLVEREINVLKSNIMDFTRREEEVKERAAAYQASGQTPPESLTRILTELDEQRYHAQQQLLERQTQYREVMDRYDRHAKRLKELRPELGPSIKEEEVR